MLRMNFLSGLLLNSVDEPILFLDQIIVKGEWLGIRLLVHFCLALLPLRLQFVVLFFQCLEGKLLQEQKIFLVVASFLAHFGEEHIDHLEAQGW